MGKYVPDVQLPVPAHLSATVGLGRLLGEMAQRGAYDSRPDSPAYASHHFMQPLAPDESVTAAYPALLGSGRTYVPAVIRETDQDRTYVDPYRFPKAPGAIGRVAQFSLGRTGLQQGHSFDAAEIQRRQVSADRVEMSTPTVQIKAFPNEPLGKVTDMSPGKQLRHAWLLARG
jgi:hypothetical protein